MTELWIAVKTGDLEEVKRLIENGADMNVKDNFDMTGANTKAFMRKTVLHYAAQSGLQEIVNFLVNSGADVNARDYKKRTILHFAVQSGSLEIVKFLFENGADVNERDDVDRTVLQYAALSGSLEIVKFLVENGADVNVIDHRNMTVLHYVVQVGSYGIAKYLVENGADVHAKDLSGATPLVTALELGIRPGSLDFVKFLLEHGADVNTKSRPRTSALGFAVKLGSLEAVKYLVEHGANVTSYVHGHPTILHYACCVGNDEIVDYLLQHGAMEHINKRDWGGKSPLAQACARGHTATVDVLLRFNVDLRQEKELKCLNDEIVNNLQQELIKKSIKHSLGSIGDEMFTQQNFKKSTKHHEKLQILESMDHEMLTKVRPPLKFFSNDISLSLGTGAMGTSVFPGILENGREVAVKRMLIQSSESAAENEKNILNFIGKKGSPYVASYRHFFKDDTFMYLIIDLCEETLKQLVYSSTLEHLQQNGPRMIKEILTGLAFLHGQGILHRDLKPSNVLVDIEGHMKLADFGISRVLNEDETTVLTDAIGSSGWMAAEVIQEIDQTGISRFKKKSDVQVAGMVAFFILTKGDHPFGSSVDRMVNIAKGKPVDLKKLRDAEARQFVSWLISRKIEKRPYADEAVEALKHIPPHADITLTRIFPPK